MWGEFNEEKPEGELFSSNVNRKVNDTEVKDNDDQIITDTDDICQTVAKCEDAFFRSQQRDEPDLSIEQKIQIAKETLDQNPGLFLYRYGKHLNSNQLKTFERWTSNDYEVAYHLKNLQNSRNSKAKKTKNRRFKAAQQMIQQNDDYFSEMEMKSRDPLLYERMIGQYMTQEEKYEQDRDNRSNCSLTKIILDHMDLNRERELKRLQEAAEPEIDEEVEGVSNERSANPDDEITDEEREVLKDDFRQAMIQSFVDGKDVNFDYKNIDENSEFDDNELMERDAEDEYFDKD